ncbi:MAG TPA: hypothetical protein VI356_26720 [Myxococcales bacterium]
MRTPPPRTRPLWRCAALAAVALLASACIPDADVPGGPGIPGGPVPPPKGRRQAQVATAVIDASGGSLSLQGTTSETMTVTVPPGAVAAPTSFSLTSITNTAPGGYDSAFRIEAPAGLQLAAPMTLTFTRPDPTIDVSQLTAAYQSATGYWFRVYAVARDSVAQTVALQSFFIGDWSLVTLATSRDLHGPFRVDSTAGLPMTATGEVTLQWLGDDPAFAYYLPQGDITLATPLASGTATCAPDAQATQTMPFSVAEIRNLPAPVQFRWGLNGRWDVTCTDGTKTSVSTGFDSMGIDNIGCLLGYVGTPIIDSTHVQGQLLIDCTARPGNYKVVGSWDLVLPAATPGALPPPPAPWP